MGGGWREGGREGKKGVRGEEAEGEKKKRRVQVQEDSKEGEKGDGNA